jgi:hypothetical protein
MAQLVTVGDALFEAARTAAEKNQRSMAARIEHWANLFAEYVAKHTDLYRESG